MMEIKDIRDLRSKNVGPVMSNSDHEVEEGAEEKLKADSDCYGEYSAWNFFSNVYYDEEARKFKAQIWVYSILTSELEADSLQELMKISSENYGYN